MEITSVVEDTPNIMVWEGMTKMPKRSRKKLTIEELARTPQEELYLQFVKNRITLKTPYESEGRKFPVGARAYKWTNESLISLEEDLQVDLGGRNMLIVSASGDPFMAFAYLNAGHQVGFDSSHRAIIWDEIKLAAVKTMDYEEFKEFTSSGDTEKTRKVYDEKISPVISEYARTIFTAMLDKYGNLNNMSEHGIFRGNTAYFPQSNIYLSNEKNYSRAKEKLVSKGQVIIPAGIDEIFALTKEKFGGFYGSNILDHFRNGRGHIDYSEGNIRPFLEKINSKMSDDAVIILQFEWSQELRDLSERILTEMGYEFKISERSRAYGNISASFRRK